ncbi:MAG: hypothetical protein ACR2IF_15410 [Terriglobales bacterium]
MGRVEEHLAHESQPLSPEAREHLGLTLRAVGWLLLIFTVMIDSVFVFVGLRDGSLLWLYLTVAQSVMALGLIAAGIYEERRAVLAKGHEPLTHVDAGEVERRAA